MSPEQRYYAQLCFLNGVGTVLPDGDGMDGEAASWWQMENGARGFGFLMVNTAMFDLEESLGFGDSDAAF